MPDNAPSPDRLLIRTLSTASSVQDLDRQIAGLRAHPDVEDSAVWLAYTMDAPFVSNLYLDEAIEAGSPRRVWQVVRKGTERALVDEQTERLAAWATQCLRDILESDEPSYGDQFSYLSTVIEHLLEGGHVTGMAPLTRTLLDGIQDGGWQAAAEIPAHGAEHTIRVALACRGLDAETYVELYEQVGRWDDHALALALGNPDLPEYLARELIRAELDTGIAGFYHQAMPAIAQRVVRLGEPWADLVLGSGSPNAFQVLLDAERPVALRALYAIADTLHADQLTPVLKDVDWCRRNQMGRAELAPLLRSPHRDVRLAALEALSHIEGEQERGTRTGRRP